MHDKCGRMVAMESKFWVHCALANISGMSVDVHAMSARLQVQIGGVRGNTTAGSMKPAVIQQYRACTGTVCTRTRYGCGVHGCGYGVGVADPYRTRAEP